MSRKTHLPEIFSGKDLVSFFSNISDPKYFVFFLIKLNCGLRIGELSSLKKKNVILDVDSPYIKIRSCNDHPEDNPKNDTERDVPITPSSLIPILRKWLIIIGDSDYLFPSRVLASRHLSQRHVRDIFYEIMKKADLLKKKYTQKDGRARYTMCPHAFRHTYGTYWLKNKLDVIKIAQNMGHKDLKMILNVYGQLLQEERATEMRDIQEGKLSLPSDTNFNKIEGHKQNSNLTLSNSTCDSHQDPLFQIKQILLIRKAKGELSPDMYKKQLEEARLELGLDTPDYFG